MENSAHDAMTRGSRLVPGTPKTPYTLGEGVESRAVGQRVAGKIVLVPDTAEGALAEAA